jgi:hypothetical protein
MANSRLVRRQNPTSEQPLRAVTPGSVPRGRATRRARSVGERRRIDPVRADVGDGFPVTDVGVAEAAGDGAFRTVRSIRCAAVSPASEQLVMPARGENPVPTEPPWRNQTRGGAVGRTRGPVAARFDLCRIPHATVPPPRRGTAGISCSGDRGRSFPTDPRRSPFGREYRRRVLRSKILAKRVEPPLEVFTLAALADNRRLFVTVTA